MRHFPKIVLVWFLFLPFFSQAQKNENPKTENASMSTLKFRTDFWCPFVCEPGENPGIVMEVVQRALGDKYKIDYQLINWARAVSDTREGVYDGLVGAAVTDAPDLVFPKEAQATASYQFFTKKSHPWKYKGSLESRKIGVINSYTYDDLITGLINKKDPHFVMISGDKAQEQMMQMLMAGRIDTVYEDPSVFKTTLQRLNLKESDFESAGAPSQPPQFIFVAFSPKLKIAPELASQIDKTVKQMRKSGEFKKLLEKYHLKDWK